MQPQTRETTKQAGELIARGIELLLNGAKTPATKTRTRAAQTEEETEEDTDTDELSMDDDTEEEEEEAEDADDTEEEEEEEEEEEGITLTQMLDAFKKYAKKNGRDKAAKVLKKYGAKAVKDLREKDYETVLKAISK